METGIQIEPMFGFTFEDVKAIAQQGEAAGFTHLWVTDHFFLRPDQPQTNCLESWTLLSALAQVTSRLRLGTLVTCQSYRPPSLVAKISAGLDVMSGGRLELGIGAGWKEVEYRAYGIPFPPAGVRIAQLVDAIHIIRAMWTEERATYRGRHYAIEEALCAPKPVQRPHPPILIGGLRPRLMRVQARYANAVNFTDFFLSPDGYAQKVADLRSACEVGYEVTQQLSAWKSRFTNNVGYEPKGLYWGIKLGDERKGAWKIDIWFLDVPSYEEHSKYCAHIRERLTPETRSAILVIKEAYWRRREYRDTITSDLIYRAVLDHDVRNVQDFERYLTTIAG